MTEIVDGIEVTPSSGDVFEDLGLKRAIGDLVEFVDGNGVRWRGALVDICEHTQISGIAGLLTRESLRGYEAIYPDVEWKRWGYVAIIAQRSTTAVLLDQLAIVEKGWWHKANRRKPPFNQRHREEGA